MSTEEKIIENLETVEPIKPIKPKRRFQLDKKHLQGFIAGLLVAAIAFTGLYYGTEGRFFKGEMYINCTYATDVTFEDEVIKSYTPVLVIFYSKWESQSISLCKMARNVAQYYDGLIKFVFVNRDEEPELTAKYLAGYTPTCFIFRDGKMVSRKAGFMSAIQLGDWVRRYYTIYR